MSKPTYYRQSRTPTSEQYEVMQGETRLGHLDLHFGSTEVFATLVLDSEQPEDELNALIDQIDEDLVLSADVPRRDFLMRVYVGREIVWRSDALSGDEFVMDGQNAFEEE